VSTRVYLLIMLIKQGST